MLTESTERRYQAYQQVVADLLQQREANGHWVGELSTSALSTATAVSALSTVLSQVATSGASTGQKDLSSSHSSSIDTWRSLQAGGVQWLAQHQNADGGWGDTELSYSNISTSMLVRAAFKLAGVSDRYAEAMTRVDQYIQQQGDIEGLRRRYGKDKTFAVPILANCAIAGQVDWGEVSPLPFEAAWVPQRFYRWMQLPVVSYAIPALVAIGQARFYHCPPKNPITRAMRRAAVEPTLQVLLRMQPASGGYLEAIPLTSFVVMGLASTRHSEHPVVQAGLRFIETSVRTDGSWPIDTNLACWNTTLSVNALCAGIPAGAADDEPHGRAKPEHRSLEKREAEALVSSEAPLITARRALQDPRLHQWILDCQHTRVHPFTGARPGGWGWTDLSGAVPDADDTPSAMLALCELDRRAMLSAATRANVVQAVRMGVNWLLDLQNRDGGWPTFCRGWGKLPFDRSGADLTAHVMRALLAWTPEFDSETSVQLRIERACDRGLRYLEKQQRADGSWLPLWFGNQDQTDDENPVYGTAKVLLALRDLGQLETEMARRGLEWLKNNQNDDGGWGGGPSWGTSRAGIRRSVGVPRVQRTRTTPSERAKGKDIVRATGELNLEFDQANQEKAGDKQQNVNLDGFPGGSSVEETALAIEAFLAFQSPGGMQMGESERAGLERGVDWLTQAIEAGWHLWQSPIGFYFAKLWYHERLYPLVFSASAMAHVVRSESRSTLDNKRPLDRSLSGAAERTTNPPAAASTGPHH